MTYDSNAYHGGTVPIGNARWYRNAFNGVRFIVDALPDDFRGNSIQKCQFEFLPGGVTPMELADHVEPMEPQLSAALRAWVASGGWKPPTAH